MEELAAAETPLHIEDPPPLRVRLGSKQAIKRTLARIVRECLDGKRPSGDLGRYVNALQVLFGMASELEAEAVRDEIEYDEEQPPYDPQKDAELVRYHELEPPAYKCFCKACKPKWEAKYGKPNP